MNKDQITDSDPIMIKGGCIDDVDRACNPLGRVLQTQRYARRHDPDGARRVRSLCLLC